MSNRCKPGGEYSLPRNPFPDDPVDMAFVTTRPEIGVTKVTVIRAARANADDMTAQARPNGQFLHIPARLPASTLPGVGRNSCAERSFKGDERRAADRIRG
jgi:hypothetical protein